MGKVLGTILLWLLGMAATVIVLYALFLYWLVNCSSPNVVC